MIEHWSKHTVITEENMAGQPVMNAVPNTAKVAKVKAPKKVTKKTVKKSLSTSTKKPKKVS